MLARQDASEQVKKGGNVTSILLITVSIRLIDPNLKQQVTEGQSLCRIAWNDRSCMIMTREQFNTT